MMRLNIHYAIHCGINKTNNIFSNINDKRNFANEVSKIWEKLRAEQFSFYLLLYVLS